MSGLYNDRIYSYHFFAHLLSQQYLCYTLTGEQRNKLINTTQHSAGYWVKYPIKGIVNVYMY